MQDRNTPPKPHGQINSCWDALEMLLEKEKPGDLGQSLKLADLAESIYLSLGSNRASGKPGT